MTVHNVMFVIIRENTKKIFKIVHIPKGKDVSLKILHPTPVTLGMYTEDVNEYKKVPILDVIVPNLYRYGFGNSASYTVKVVEATTYVDITLTYQINKNRR